MSLRKRISAKSSASAEEEFKRFIIAKMAKGLADKTLKTYQQHLSAISKHLDLRQSIEKLNTNNLEQMIVSMREAGLSSNTIRSYTRTMKSFLSWCNEEGITDLTIPLYKAEETIKETYSDSELKALLKKPDTRHCKFSEYRNWVIINLLINNGCRAATVRNIKNRDVDLQNRIIYLRHTKNKKSQSIPLCDSLCSTFKEYLRIRGGNDYDYLFPNEFGEQLSENGLRCSIAKYNRKRGVEKTSLHMFRHTFARKYLVDCGGNAFTLQHLLGHSTLDMTKHYCAIFDADIAKNYDQFSPLAQIQKNNSKKISMKRKPVRTS